MTVMKTRPFFAASHLLISFCTCTAQHKMNLIKLACILLPVSGLNNAPLANPERAEAAITDGASIGKSNVNGTNQSSSVLLENWTRFTLVQSHFRILGGTVTSLAGNVLPAIRELAIRFDSIETSGFASWLVEPLDERFVFAWDVSEAWNASWLAIGLCPPNLTDNPQNDETLMQLTSVLNHTSVHASRDEDFIKKLWDRESNVSLTLTIPKDIHGQPFLAKLKVVPSRYEDLAQPILEALDQDAPAASSGEWKMEVGGCYGPACVQFKFDSSGVGATTYQPFLFVTHLILAVKVSLFCL